VFTPPPIDPDGRIAKSLRPLRIFCAALAAAVGIFIVLSWVLLEGMAIHPPPGIPQAVPISMAAFAMILLLLSSRMRTNILRRSISTAPDLSMGLDRLLEGYRRATLVSFAMLEGAALAGLAVALLTGTAFYGIVLGAASLISMATRWPRETDVDRLARGRRSP
jgi:cytosine/uracil/thiamine/allantoin permease